MKSREAIVRLPFVFIVVFCMLQTGWWLAFHLKSVDRIERLETARVERELAGDPGARATALADIRGEATGRRWMFVLEGATFVGLLLLGSWILGRALGRELRLRLQEERFLRSATHELKTPIAAIKLGLQSLAQGRLDPSKSGEYLEQLEAELDRLELEVENMLLAAAGDRDGRGFEDGDLGADLREVLEEFGSRSRLRGVELELKLPHEPLRLSRDPLLLAQALRNLLDNAIKYSPSGSTVVVEVLEHDGRLRIRVRDQGPGVPAEDRDRIFDRFQRGHTESAEARGGSGLGLALAAEAAAVHGGSLALELGDGQGASFVLELPGGAA
ncbi:MAG: HAMP domain-containing sensor histidine kinase [Planctomycetota bacterium]